MHFRDILMTAATRGGGGIPPFSPTDLGASLIAWWDATRGDLITQAGGLVSSWKDSVAGYDAVQIVGTAQPAYSATGFNGTPVVSGDGVDDELTLAPVPAAFPIGATACEEWWLVDQKSLGADATTRVLGETGNGTAATSRRLRRTVGGGINRASLLDAAGTVTANTIDFSGRFVLRTISTGTSIDLEVNGVPTGAVAAVSAVNSNRVRFFSSAQGVAASFSLIGIAARLFTLPLTAGQASGMYSFLNQRL